MTTEDRVQIETPKGDQEGEARDGRGKQEQSQRGPIGTAWPRAVFEGNYFYIISALSMMLGCYLLMPSASITEAEQFGRRLRSLAMLQGYEVLVIAAALWIVRKLKCLDDAFTLLLIEIALLLDPTFFSNAFFTLRTPASVSLNFTCFILAPIKLGILQWGLGLRFTGRANLSFLVAAALVYLGEGPLNLARTPLTDSGYYYLMGWGAAFLILLLPTLQRFLTVAAEDSGLLAENQRKWLPWLTALIPVFIVAAHYLESASVYEITFYPLYLGPLLVAVALLIIKIARPDAVHLERSLFVDLCCGFALLLTSRGINVGSVAEPADRTLIPAWITSTTGPIVMGVAVVAVYLYFAFRLRYIPALYRVAILVSAGAVYFLVQSTLWSKGLSLSASGMEILGKTAASHPRFCPIVIGVILLAAARRFRNFWCWLLGGVPPILLAFSFLPGPLHGWVPEMVQAFLVWAVVLYHRFADPRNERVVLAVIVAIVGFTRFASDPAFWSAAIVLAESGGLVAAGFYCRQKGYLVTGLLQGCAFGFVGFRSLSRFIHPGYAVVGVALLLFGVGLVVTFRKKRILEWFDRCG